MQWKFNVISSPLALRSRRNKKQATAIRMSPEKSDQVRLRRHLPTDRQE